MMINVRTRRCMICGLESVVSLDSKKVQRWEDGEHVQNIWPDMPPAEREMLITGTHPHCWDILFTEEETAYCKHCDREIVKEGDMWVDPQATDDDEVWRETCDSHDTFIANHEPLEEEE